MLVNHSYLEMIKGINNLIYNNLQFKSNTFMKIFCILKIRILQKKFSRGKRIWWARFYAGKHRNKLLEFNTFSAVVQLHFLNGSTFPVPVCTVPRSMNRISQWNKVDAVRLYASYMLNLLLLKKQRCMNSVLLFSRFRCEIAYMVPSMIFLLYCIMIYNEDSWLPNH